MRSKRPGDLLLLTRFLRWRMSSAVTTKSSSSSLGNNDSKSNTSRACVKWRTAIWNGWGNIRYDANHTPQWRTAIWNGWRNIRYDEKPHYTMAHCDAEWMTEYQIWVMTQIPLHNGALWTGMDDWAPGMTQTLLHIGALRSGMDNWIIVLIIIIIIMNTDLMHSTMAHCDLE